MEDMMSDENVTYLKWGTFIVVIIIGALLAFFFINRYIDTSTMEEQTVENGQIISEEISNAIETEIAYEQLYENETEIDSGNYMTGENNATQSEYGTVIITNGEDEEYIIYDVPELEEIPSVDGFY